MIEIMLIMTLGFFLAVAARKHKPETSVVKKGHRGNDFQLCFGITN